jgi:hypothetical protein
MTVESSTVAGMAVVAVVGKFKNRRGNWFHRM